MRPKLTESMSIIPRSRGAVIASQGYGGAIVYIQRGQFVCQIAIGG